MKAGPCPRHTGRMPRALAGVVVFLAAAAILVLLVILLLMNSVAIYLRNRYEQKW